MKLANPRCNSTTVVTATTAPVGSQTAWRKPAPLPAGLRNSHQNGGPAFPIFVSDPTTVRLCNILRRGRDRRSALGRQYAAWAIGAVGASVGAGAPLRRKVVGLADVPHAQAEISHLFFSVPSVVHAQGIRASSVRLSGLASRCSAPSPMPALARRQGAIQAIGRIYRSCVFNSGDQPIGELARRWKTIASWRSRCRNSTTFRSLLKS